MKVKISVIGHGQKFIRADIVKSNGDLGRNLYHMTINPNYPFKLAFDGLIDNVSFNNRGTVIEWTTDPAYNYLMPK